MRILKKNYLLSLLNGMVIDYKCPPNLTYLWNFGSLAGICLVIQIITGIALSMHYCAHVDLAFISVEHIMRDVNYGWLMRYIHANGASMFFVTVYIHMLRGMYYGSYTFPRVLLWVIGVAIFVLMMATAFIGYVLPWGQMSFWGATVITNLVSAVPYVGKDIVIWIWGGFSVDNPTLNRFYSFHYVLPFIIAGLALMHLMVLHINGSGNPLGIKTSHIDTSTFHPYYTTKDFFGIIIFFMIFSYFVFFNPNILGHPDNYIPASPLKTPTHIVPEWYFLPFYAILRSCPDKLGGVLSMGASILILLVLPLVHSSEVRSGQFRPIFTIFFYLFLVSAGLLGWIGGCSTEEPYYTVGQYCTYYYFGFFLFIIPVTGIIENGLANHPYTETLKSIIEVRGSENTSVPLTLIINIVGSIWRGLFQDC